MSLEDMVNVFEEMCGTPFDEERILFETRLTSEKAEFSESIWDEDLDENIFDYIRNSEVFVYAKDKECLKVKIYLDET